jgi:hypothetical protein
LSASFQPAHLSRSELLLLLLLLLLLVTRCTSKKFDLRPSLQAG